MPYTGEEIARELGIRYDGMQDFIGMQFTDFRFTGTTFYANSLEEAAVKLMEKRILFRQREEANIAENLRDYWRHQACGAE